MIGKQVSKKWWVGLFHQSSKQEKAKQSEHELAAQLPIRNGVSNAFICN